MVLAIYVVRTKNVTNDKGEITESEDCFDSNDSILSLADGSQTYTIKEMM